MGFLVIGSDGCIGAALYRHLGEGGETVWGTTRRDQHPDPTRRKFQLDSPEQIEALPELPAVHTAFLCAGVNSLRRCAMQPDTTHRINVVQTLDTARRLAARNIFVVFLSTSLVFDSHLAAPAEDAALCPNSEYGWQMAEAEKGIRGLGILGCIARISKALPPQATLFRSWLRDLRAGRPITGYTDVHFAPVDLQETVRVLAALGTSREYGIHHLAGDRNLSYYEAALLLARHAGLPAALVRGVASADAGVDPEHAPAHIALSSRRDWRFTPVEELIRRYAHAP